MRAKRSKAYKKLMGQFALTFGFREPYQVLVDADFVLTGAQCKMELMRRLEDTLHGSVKPLITQCCMRHLYARSSEPGANEAIEKAKSIERRRCGHHPDEYPEPLSAMECINSVVDPKDAGVNKFRYCCAVNDDEVRASLRQIPGVPLMYIRRSVLIMEPMATVSAKERSRDERSKFRAELKTPASKRKRADDSEEEADLEDNARGKAKTDKPKKKKIAGRKEPNPLSVKKKKSKAQGSSSGQAKDTISEEAGDKKEKAAPEGMGPDEVPKKKRRRKHKPRPEGETAEPSQPGQPDHTADAMDVEE
ncbi:Fcf1-domain-containing protein [Xylariomycetidae sp. FL0641]|nr:Fcf1-domain-containing protein [Xylariomycetidae sp. FL0641]